MQYFNKWKAKLNEPKLHSILRKLLIVYLFFISFYAFWTKLQLNYWKEAYLRLIGNTAIETVNQVPFISPSPNMAAKEPVPITCVNDKTTLFTGDRKEFAACLEDGIYQVYRSTFEGYGRFWEETGRYEADDEIVIAYADYERSASRVANNLRGSRVFRITKTDNPSLSELVNALEVPDKENWFDGLEYSAQFSLEDADWVRSPKKDVYLISVTICTGCSAIPILYAYDSRKDELIRIGSPFSSSNQDAEGFDITWLGDYSLKWREGRWRERTDDEIETGYEFPGVQDDLGFRITEI